MNALPPSSKTEQQVSDESSYERATRKIREEPLVPVGILATCVTLFGASVALRRGNQGSANKFFRWRIYAQGFTVAAMVAGSVYYGDTRVEAKREKEERERVRAVEARDRWLADLDAYEEERKAEEGRRAARRAARAARAEQA
ncbi:Altered inheritance of mitochondria protein 31, mitochondrial [Taphrina deformans PYCC 5710]|uniref:Altered inheritance of mitochondria protein 31, mitochondrial n=1 Tax=Taphrina deformans (strain PYCC 5710 / ATCC 11124 / CBS 356.35 / IMI 108563 / JCM 9778 / NBRC 8474) TaxID=1097556 RepID=R4X9E5_TAPDE|nr:Altered inheritance of mitochondria protein 31, mitochondrial [Taphrina deformans PYCC 5710]|eukprot:CCG82361.1 Altered inheritance of mitochondria protein 31, mitochondrial [Taphrina deformans PYCC 5710]